MSFALRRRQRLRVGVHGGLQIGMTQHRLSREGVLPTLQQLQRLTSYGSGYRSFTEQYFDSCGIFRDAVIAIVATVAKQERIRISERVKAGLVTDRPKKASGWAVPEGSFPAPGLNPCAKKGNPGGRSRRSSIPTQPRPGEHTLSSSPDSRDPLLV